MLPQSYIFAHGSHRNCTCKVASCRGNGPSRIDPAHSTRAESYDMRAEIPLMLQFPEQPIQILILCRDKSLRFRYTLQKPMGNRTQCSGNRWAPQSLSSFPMNSTTPCSLPQPNCLLPHYGITPKELIEPPHLTRSRDLGEIDTPLTGPA